jgi:hypothetical protein
VEHVEQVAQSWAVKRDERIIFVRNRIRKIVPATSS